MNREKLPSGSGSGEVPYPTDDEKDERVQFCYEMLRKQAYTSEIKRKFREKFTKPGEPELSARGIQGYIAKAKVLVLADASDGVEVMRAQSHGRYLSVFEMPGVEPQHIIQAQTRIDRLFGLEAPTKIAPTSPDGEEPYEQLTDEERAIRLEAILAAARARRDRSAVADGPEGTAD